MNNYINRLRSYDSNHRTANYIKSWKSNQRLKKESPLSRAVRCDMFQFDVEPLSPFFAVNPLIDLSNVHFNTDLAYKISKNNDNPILMRMLGLEMLSSIPTEATRIYTDGSKLENGSCGSGSVIFRPYKEPIHISRRTPNHSSSYRSELIVILDSF